MEIITANALLNQNEYEYTYHPTYQFDVQITNIWFVIVIVTHAWERMIGTKSGMRILPMNLNRG